ncbi:DUF1963 domain-containing protein [Corynebacterium pacaense]|uniref:DUF1963 domain-containing protein n=1 Tax=Corynebacterium pacaense TaxID=1816684 RepID=UPI0009BBC5F8|nr:DUF1963 domain-containing protein [Corynebacterium pacaense]
MRTDALPRRPRISLIAAVDGDSGQFLPAAPWDSKLGGAPYRTVGAGWPHRRGADGVEEPLGFLAQINLDQIERWCRRTGSAAVLDGDLPTHGLLQFFLPLMEGWGLMEGDTFVTWYPQVTESEDALDDRILAVIRGDGPTFVAETPNRQLRAGRPSSACTSNAWSWSPLTQPENPVRLEPAAIEPLVQMVSPHNDRSLPAELRFFPEDRESQDAVEKATGTGGTQVGGFPFFTQVDPRPSGTTLQLLMQLDGIDNAVVIGDSGVMNFFISPEDLRTRDFRRVQMNWDCC